MRCPFCQSGNLGVKDSRPTEDGAAVRRRRSCSDCGARFTTFERVHVRMVTVVKKSGKREVFDRDKLARSMTTALRKRPVDPERVEHIVNGLVRRIETAGEAEVSSSIVGAMVMDALSALDPVAYIRFASVYREFREAKDFGAFITEN